MLVSPARWRPLLDGPITWLYADVRGPGTDEADGVRLRWRAIRSELADAGAGEDDLDALAQAIEEVPGRGDSLACYAASAGGHLRHLEEFDGAPMTAPSLGHGPSADILPLVVHAAHDVPYMLVEAGRDGGEISLHGGSVTEVSRDVQGDDHHLSKVRGGGWSHRRLQQHTEEVWRRNAAELVDSVVDLWQHSAPRLLVLAGDVRAREKVRRALPEHLERAVAEVDRHTVPEGASSQAIDRTISRELERLATDEEHAAIDELAAQLERGEAAGGLRATVEALRSARAGVVLVDPTALPDQDVVVLDEAPWVAMPPEGQAHRGDVSRTAAAHVGILRAAALTGASVMVTEHDHLPGGTGIAALVRWPVTPAP